MPDTVTRDEPDPVGTVISLNLKRRHLTSSQLGAVGVEVERIEALLAKERQGTRTDITEQIPESDKGEAREKAARAVGSNAHYVSDAKMIAEESPELFEEVKNGTKTITQATRQITAAKVQKKVSLPDAKYRIVYADPPWSYGNTQPDYQTEQRDHYPVMPLKEICAIPVADICDDNAVLFMWVTSPILRESFQVIQAWGFQYKASFVWDKVKHNMGHYNSVRHEFLLVCVRGSCQPDVKKLFDSVVSVERTKHSRKPEIFYEIIDTLYPHGKRIELFARSQRNGWDTHGNEETKFAA